MSSHTETSLKALTVPKLKELLAKHALPQTGKKDELIARLLEHPEALLIGTSSSEPAEPSASNGTEALQKGAASSQQPLSPPVNPPVVASAKGEPVPAPETVPAPSADEIAAAAAKEKEKREARAARFGTTQETGGNEELNKRAERFGLESKANGQDKVVQSLAAIDRPLGVKPERKGKGPKPAPVEGKAQQSEKGQAAVAAAPVDPEIVKKLAEEEEKKKKRAARFGPPAPNDDTPLSKKTKSTA